MARFYCRTCATVVTVEDSKWNPDSDAHKEHDKMWILRPDPTVIAEAGKQESVTIENEDLFDADVKAIRQVMANMNSVVFERQEAIKVLILAALCKEHVIIYGPPGTGKNFMTYRFAESVGRSFFEYMIHQGTGEDELIGPIDFKELELNGRQVRKTQGRLLTSEYAFLDEFGNSSSLLRNMLKGIMNEGKYDYGDLMQQVPLQMIVAASNSMLDISDETEAALEDRFLFRLRVQRIQEDENLLHMLELVDRNVTMPAIDHAVLTRLQKYVTEVTVTPEFRRALISISNKMSEETPGGVPGISSDRRIFKIVRAAAAHAVLNGRRSLKRNDLNVLAHIAWRNFETEMIPVQEWVKENLASNLGHIEGFLNTLDDIKAAFDQVWDDDAAANITDKVQSARIANESIARTKKLVEQYRATAEDSEEIDALHQFDVRASAYAQAILLKTLDMGDSEDLLNAMGKA